ncbi:MAG: GNAT family N-acetyltransferase [Acidiferrobacterales bacterium]
MTTLDDVLIRTGEEGDAAALTEFNIAMALETEGRVLTLGVVSNGVQTLLKNPEYGFYVIVEKSGEIAGSLMVTTEWSDWRDGEFWWVQSVYVRRDYRRQGIYRKLYEYIKAKAAKRGNVCGFRLSVERDNAVAQQAYLKLGMSETCYKIFEELV